MLFNAYEIIDPHNAHLNIYTLPRIFEALLICNYLYPALHRRNLNTVTYVRFIVKTELSQSAYNKNTIIWSQTSYSMPSDSFTVVVLRSFDVSVAACPRTEFITKYYHNTSGRRISIPTKLLAINIYRQDFNQSGTLVGNKIFYFFIFFWRCSNYIFILDIRPGFNGLGKDNGKTTRETFNFWDLVRLIFEVWR